MLTILNPKNAAVVKAVEVDGLSQHQAARLARIDQGSASRILKRFTQELRCIIGDLDAWSPWFRRDCVTLLLQRAEIERTNGKHPRPMNRLDASPILQREHRAAAPGGTSRKKRGRPSKTTPPDP